MYDMTGTVKRKHLATGEKEYMAIITKPGARKHQSRRRMRTATQATAYGARLARRATSLAKLAQHQEEETERILQQLQRRMETDLKDAALQGRPKDQSE